MLIGVLLRGLQLSVGGEQLLFKCQRITGGDVQVVLQHTLLFSELFQLVTGCAQRFAGLVVLALQLAEPLLGFGKALQMSVFKSSELLFKLCVLLGGRQAILVGFAQGRLERVELFAERLNVVGAGLQRFPARGLKGGEIGFARLQLMRKGFSLLRFGSERSGLFGRHAVLPVGIIQAQADVLELLGVLALGFEDFAIGILQGCNVRITGLQLA
ncbi:hypothetical protein D3C76_805530 [compost metagenome]